MNPQWNTPPNGDFASYVERLSAQSALPKRAGQEGDHGLDVGMTPSSEPHGAASAAASAAQRRLSSNGEAAVTVPSIGGVAGKLLLGVGVVVLVLLWAAQVPVGILVLLAAGGAWLAYQLRQFKLPGGGVAKWQKVLEDAARKQREQQRKAK
ncbi:hypothetical protein [Variovorax sp. PAMC 28711]|uniref:hypothetical protein n=1 Tax=Variovorax sp. PAMC 28711 TaxID=1795631 RepID=UPI00078E5566|nr:hypothetical protein [Variovorax sp. PAMC 28711]AMM23300.1 hypothetical protein AX767_02130 [Variovorax sp. PAMC 28711]